MRLAALACGLQAVPLWVLVGSPPPAVTIAAPMLSGLGNGTACRR